MDGFSATTCHLMLGTPKDGEERRGFGSVAVHRIQHQLHLLDSEIFPHLPFDMRVEGETEQTEAAELECQTLTKFNLRPLQKLNMSLVPTLNPKEYVNESLAQEGFPVSLEALKSSLSDAVPISSRVYPRVTFLGTGSCIPNKTRNTSGILVELE
jgi:ribonuclease Z